MRLSMQFCKSNSRLISSLNLKSHSSKSEATAAHFSGLLRAVGVCALARLC